MSMGSHSSGSRLRMATGTDSQSIMRSQLCLYESELVCEVSFAEWTSERTNATDDFSGTLE